jgi:Protein of unknown function (DUF3352)
MEFSQMQMAQRAIRRLAFIGWLGLVGLAGLPDHSARAAAPPERMLPDTTLFLLKLNDVKSFRESFRSSQYGQLWNDPGLKDFREELSVRLEDASKALKERIGVSFRELVELPQGALAIAVLGRDDPNLPAAGVLIAEAGENQKKLEEVFDRASKQAEDAGAKVAKEPFNSLTLHIVQPPKQGDEPRPPLVWTNAGSLFFVGSDVEIVKDLAAHREGRENSLGAADSFTKTLAKTDASKSQAVWYVDVAKIVKLVIKANNKENKAQAEQADLMATELGAYGLKSVGGSVALGTGAYDSQTKIFFNAPKPVTGILKLFSLPPVTLRPESWVPATVATYQTISWDLDNLFTAVDDLVNKFQPGMINLVQQQLVGPEGGQPLDFKADIFGPLGNRISVITDYKKPIKEDSQRTLMAVALENPKAFQNTLTRLLQIANAAPEKREFQGTTIYDFAVNLPAGPQGNAAAALKGPISIAIAKDELFVTTDTTLLEQVLRPGNATLADSTSYQTIAKEFPEKISGMTYVRPDESARLSYDMLKNGTFAKALQQGMAGARQGREMPDLNKLIPIEKLPDFGVFAKYLSLGGSSSVMDDDGFTMTGFTLRHANP